MEGRNLRLADEQSDLNWQEQLRFLKKQLDIIQLELQSMRERLQKLEIMNDGK